MKVQIKGVVFEWFWSFALFNVVNIIINIFFVKFPNWELFSYHLYGSFISYLICFSLLFGIYKMFPSIVKHRFLSVLILLFSLEASFFIISGVSLSYTIFAFAWSDKNYMMFFYPFSLIATRVISIIRNTDSVSN
jgi:hypothetical protein